MRNIQLWRMALVIGIGVLGTSVSSGQAYPNRPVRIVTGPAGGGGDIATRVIAQAISPPLGQPVVVDNRANAVIGGFVTKAPPDGYTLTLVGNVLWISPFFDSVSYDMNDLAPITLINRAPNVLVVNPSLPVKSVQELIALAKARPGELNYAHGGLGSASFLAAELLKNMAGVNIVAVSFRGGDLQNTAVLSGDVQMEFSAGVGEYIKAGRLRALAVTSAQPSPLAPGLPTVAQAVPGYVSETVQAIFAPAKTPDAIIQRLNQEIVRVLNRGDIKERFLNAGSETAPSSPDEAAATIKADITRMGKLIKDIPH